MMRTTKHRSLGAQELVPGVTLEDEIYERVVYGGALGEEAWQQGDKWSHVALFLGVKHAPEAGSHVRSPGNKEP